MSTRQNIKLPNAFDPEAPMTADGGLIGLSDAQSVAVNNEIANHLVHDLGKKAQHQERQQSKPSNSLGTDPAFQQDVHPESLNPQSHSADIESTPIPANDPEAKVDLENKLQAKKLKQLGLTHSSAPTFTMPGS